MEARQYYRTNRQRYARSSRNKNTRSAGSISFLISQAALSGLLLVGMLISSIVALPGAHQAWALIEHIIRYEGEPLGVLDGLPFLSSAQNEVSAPYASYPEPQAPQHTHSPNLRIDSTILEGLRYNYDTFSPTQDTTRPISDTYRTQEEPQALRPAIPPGIARISSGFGYRQSPITGEEEFHNGVDIALPAGSEVVAIQYGYVTYVGHNPISGNFMRYSTLDGLLVGYAHLQEVLVAVGDEIHQGQVIALSGASGAVDGAHLHVSIWRDGELLDPLYVFGDKIP